MKERPILFSAPMVRALLAGTKTQTRRVVKPQPEQGCIGRFGPGNPFIRGERDATRCPYGQPGDRLWVREAFSGPHCMDATDECVAVQPSKWGEGSRIWYWADGNPTHGDWTRPRPSIHMPRWASRILLDVTAVRVERLQDISEADAKAEGITPIWPDGPRDDGGPNHFTVDVDPGHLNGPTAATVYRMLWELINGEGSWGANPWVWVVEFKRVTP
ncbi:MAG: hypothetical protein WCY72_10945 [Lysobacteraceae bacterium]